jgi:membrane protein YdbS with pleckstrin-like domain
LAGWFRVPRIPPALPAGPVENSRTFRPAEGFLRYLKFQFWVALFVIDIAIIAAWLAITIRFPEIALVLAPLAFLIVVVPDIIAYVAIHLRYDTTWYVMTDRSLRVRTGVWVIHETTITFENVQNVAVESGPLQRWFGIADVTVETAGGSSPSSETHSKSSTNYHEGRIEGVDNALEIRNLILKRVRGSRAAGLGDETTYAAGWSSQHVAMLREIRDSLATAMHRE